MSAVELSLERLKMIVVLAMIREQSAQIIERGKVKGNFKQLKKKEEKVRFFENELSYCRARNIQSESRKL
jgi:RNA-binding protein YlmH